PILVIFFDDLVKSIMSSISSNPGRKFLYLHISVVAGSFCELNPLIMSLLVFD
uniref:Uncharacterized protein n=1 Tax=Aegilops tauschii subsp. strangulata TaxID=200361 RepID=A0A453EG10_AEGTS